MSLALSTVTTKVRELINDTVKTTVPGDIFTYASSDVFTLTEDNPVAISAVFKNDVEQDSSLYSFDSDTGKVTISFSASSGDTIEIRYTYYESYSDTVIQNYIKSSIAELSIQNYKTFIIESSVIYPDPEESEENLIAVIAAVLLKPDNKSYRLPDLTVNVAETRSTRQIVRDIIRNFKKGTLIIDII